MFTKYTFSLAICSILLQWCCIGTSITNVGATSLVDTTSFFTERSSESVEPPTVYKTSDIGNIFDTESFLSSPILVVKMGKGKSKPRDLTPTPHSSKEGGEEAENVIIFAKAMTAISNHLYPAAINLLENLIIRSPSDSNYHFNLGTVHQLSGNVARALDAYQMSINLEPRETRALLNFGTLVQSIGDFELAATTYRYDIRCLE